MITFLPISAGLFGIEGLSVALNTRRLNSYTRSFLLCDGHRWIERERWRETACPGGLEALFSQYIFTAIFSLPPAVQSCGGRRRGDMSLLRRFLDFVLPAAVILHVVGGQFLTYEIPRPRITVFSPRGLRFILPRE
jgi:hypothetical protein